MICISVFSSRRRNHARIFPSSCSPILPVHHTMFALSLLPRVDCNEPAFYGTGSFSSILLYISLPIRDRTMTLDSLVRTKPRYLHHRVGHITGYATTYILVLDMTRVECDKPAMYIKWRVFTVYIAVPKISNNVRIHTLVSQIIIDQPHDTVSTTPPRR